MEHDHVILTRWIPHATQYSTQVSATWVNVCLELFIDDISSLFIIKGYILLPLIVPFFIILVFLTSCAGTGSKYLSQSELQTDNSSNKVL